MARRRLLKSYFYIIYNDVAYGETVNVSPYDSTGGIDTFSLASTSSWHVISNSASEWLHLDISAGTKGNADVQMTADPNPGQTAKTGTVVVGTDDGRYSITLNVEVAGVILDGHITVMPKGTEIEYQGNRQIVYTVSWENLAKYQYLDMDYSSELRNVDPQSIHITNNPTSSVTVSAMTTANVGTGAAARNLYLRISGYDGNDVQVFDEGYFKQYEPRGEVSVGNLTYVVENAVGSEAISIVRFTDFRIGTDTKGLQGTLYAFSGIPSGPHTASTTVSWDTGTSFKDTSGKTVTGELNLTISPEMVDIPSNVILSGSAFSGGYITGNLESHGSRSPYTYYTYTFNLGTIPSTGLSLGNLFVIVPLYLEPASIKINGVQDYVLNYPHQGNQGMTYPITLANVDETSLGWSYLNQGNFTTVEISGNNTTLKVGFSENTGSTPVHSKVEVTGTSLIDGSVVSATAEVIQAECGHLYPTSASTYVDAFVSNTYDGRRVSGSVIFSYDNLTGITYQVVSGASDVSVTNIVTAATSITVNFTCTVNETTSEIIEKGIIKITGNMTDNSGSLSATIRVHQRAGVTPFILIEGDSAYSENIGYGEITGESYDLDWGWVDISSLVYTYILQGNFTYVEVRPDGDDVYVELTENTLTSQSTSAFRVTGTSVYGRTITATFTVTQNANVTPPAQTYTIGFEWYTPSSVPAGYSASTRYAGFVTYRINNGTPTMRTMTPTASISGLHEGDVISYVMSGMNENFLQYSSVVTVTGDATEHGIAVPNAFVVNMGPYSVDSRTNIFQVNYRTVRGATGITTVSCNGGNTGTTTISLGNDYVTTNSDYMAYTVSKVDGNINISGWDLSGTNGTGTNIPTSSLNGGVLTNMSITQGKPANIILRYRGTYPSLTGQITFDPRTAGDRWHSMEINLNGACVLSTTSTGLTIVNFSYISSSQVFECTISGGLGYGELYKNYRMRIFSNNMDLLFDGNCALLYVTSDKLQGVNLTASQLHGSTWVLMREES